MKKIVEYLDPFNAIDDHELAHRVLLEAVKREAFLMVDKTNPMPEIDNEPLEASEYFDEVPRKRSYITPVEEYRSRLIEQYTDNNEIHSPDILEPVERRKTKRKKSIISRAKLNNLIKAEVLKQVQERDRKNRRRMAINKLAKLSSK